MDLRDVIRRQPMRMPQFWVVAICIILAMIDGYEVVSMPFTIPYLSKSWSLGPVEIGYLLSSGVFGMALGAVLISPLADRIGRRRHIMMCLVMVTIGMVLSALCQTVVQLVVCRAFAGLFIGALISSLNIMASEYSSDHRRGTVMGIYGIGLPLGSAFAGLIIGPLIGAFDWRAPFLFGGLLTLVMLAVVWAFLPESIAYLVEKRPAGALATYNRIAVRLGHATVETLPPAHAATGERKVWRMIFSGVLLKRTVFLWLGYAGLVSAFYFANTWTAKMIADAAGDPALGLRAGVLIQTGGVLGSLAFAALSLKLRPRLVTVLILFAGAAAFILYANQIHASIWIALGLTLLVGMCANGGVAAFYAISPQVYPTIARGTGVGLMIGFGRGVAILAPLMTGYMLSGGWTPALVYQVFGVILALAGTATVLLDLTYRGTSEDPETIAAGAPAAP